jgi:hypothetical protein
MNKWIIITADIFGALTVWQALSWGFASIISLDPLNSFVIKPTSQRKKKAGRVSSLSSVIELESRNV